MTIPLMLPAQDGVIDATLHLPEGSGPFPAVILFTDFHGARPAYHALADTIAAEGYAVLLPNVYYRSSPAPVVDPAIPVEGDFLLRLRSYRALLTPEALGRDFPALIEGLATVPEVDASRIGVSGYCMGGSFALRLAAAFPDRVLAAASLHGGGLAVADDPTSPHLLAPQIKASLYIGHADRDSWAPADQIVRLDAALVDAEVHFITEYYKGAHHGFTIADGEDYDPRASKRHLQRLLQLLAETLKSPAA